MWVVPAVWTVWKKHHDQKFTIFRNLKTVLGTELLRTSLGWLHSNWVQEEQGEGKSCCNHGQKWWLWYWNRLPPNLKKEGKESWFFFPVLKWDKQNDPSTLLWINEWDGGNCFISKWEVNKDVIQNQHIPDTSPQDHPSWERKPGKEWKSMFLSSDSAISQSVFSLYVHKHLILMKFRHSDWENVANYTYHVTRLFSSLVIYCWKLFLIFMMF